MKRPTLIALSLSALACAQACTGESQAPLHKAVESGEEPAVIRQLIADGVDVNARDEYGATPLHYAARNSVELSIVEVLIAAGADVNARDEYDDTPLHDAVWNNEEMSIVEALIAAGADVNARGEYGATPLHGVAWNNNGVSIVEALIVAGADVNARDEYGDTPLHSVARHGREALIAEMLVAAGTDGIVRYEHDGAPSHYAAGYGGELSIVEALIAAGSDVNARGEYDMTPLHVAAAYTDGPSIVEALIAAGADVNARGEYGATPLHGVAWNNNGISIVEALIVAGADVNARDEYGDTPLHSVARHGREALIAEMLVAAGTDGIVRYEHDGAPSHYAAGYGGELSIVEALIAAGSDVNARGEYDMTPLHVAAAYTDGPSVVEALIAAGADVNAYESHWGATPLHATVVYNDKPSIVEALIAAGADVNAASKEPAWEVRAMQGVAGIFTGALRMVNKLSEGSENRNVVDTTSVWKEGNTPLLLALYVSRWDSSIIETLLDAGADVNVSNKEGVTPSLLANRGHLLWPAIEALRAAGVDVNVEERDTFVSSEIVRYYGDWDDIFHDDEAIASSMPKGDVWVVNEKTDFSTGERSVFSSYLIDAHTENEISIKVDCSSMTVLYKNEEAHDTQEARVSVKARINSNATIGGEAYVERVEPRPCAQPPGDSCGCPDTGKQGLAYHLDESMVSEMLPLMWSGNALLLQLEDRYPLSIGLLDFSRVYWHMQQAMGSPTYCRELEYVRDTITMSVNMIAPPTASVSQAYTAAGVMPADVAEAGMASPLDYETDAIQAIKYARLSDTVATMTISYKAVGGFVPQGATMVFTGTGGANGVQWSCKGDGSTLPEKYRPDNCRSSP